MEVFSILVRLGDFGLMILALVELWSAMRRDGATLRAWFCKDLFITIAWGWFIVVTLNLQFGFLPPGVGAFLRTYSLLISIPVGISLVLFLRTLRPPR